LDLDLTYVEVKMTLGEKLPSNYDPGKIAEIFEKFERKVVGVEKVNKDTLADLSKEFKDLVAQVEEDLNARIDSKTGEGGTPLATRLPVPQNLKCFEAVGWGFAHVDPFQRIKHLGKIRNYDFFGSNNPFRNPKSPGDTDYENVIITEPHETPYPLVGTHYGTGTEASPDSHLNTEHPTDDDLTFVLDNRLYNPLWVDVLSEKRLIIENINRSTRGVCDATEANKIHDADGDFTNKNIKAGMYAHKIGGNDDTYWTEVLTVVDSGELSLADDIFEEGDQYEVGTGRITGYRLLNPKYEITAQGVTWVEGDKWRIREYPQNKLFSIGAFASFTKRSGTFYVKARCVGTKGTYSDLTEQVESDGLSSGGNLPPVSIVYPIHLGPEPDDQVTGETCTIVGGLPVCPNHPNLTWEDIGGGTREIAHYDIFGWERSIVEVVWEEIDIDEPVIYRFQRETTDELEEEAS
jgi:hypothetical protein